jgi:hypothetical protein
MTETKYPKTARQPENFSKGFGRRNAQPAKRSKLWDPEPGIAPQLNPQRTRPTAARPLVYGTPALREIRLGIVATCLTIGALLDSWTPNYALMIAIPTLAALFWDNQRWIFGDRTLQIEYSNALRTKVVTVRPADFLAVSSRIVKGSGSETYEVLISVQPGRIHAKSYPTQQDADNLKNQVLDTLGPPHAYGS